MKNILLATILLLSISGCKLSPKPLDGDARSQNVNHELICAKEINILPISINGAIAPKDAFSYSIKKLKRYTTDNIKVHPIYSISIDHSKINDLIHDYGTSNNLDRLSQSDQSQLRQILESLPQNMTTIVMIYTPILYMGRSTNSRSLRGIAFGKRDMQPLNVVSYNKTNIDKAPVITDNQAWKIVLTHEVGHRLGVPAKASHNKKGHCTSRECIMYSAPDLQSVLSVMVLNGMPYDFCDLCKEELIDAKRGCSYIIGTSQ